MFSMGLTGCKSWSYRGIRNWTSGCLRKNHSLVRQLVLFCLSFDLTFAARYTDDSYFLCLIPGLKRLDLIINRSFIGGLPSDTSPVSFALRHLSLPDHPSIPRFLNAALHQPSLTSATYLSIPQNLDSRHVNFTSFTQFASTLTHLNVTGPPPRSTELMDAAETFFAACSNLEQLTCDDAHIPYIQYIPSALETLRIYSIPYEGLSPVVELLALRGPASLRTLSTLVMEKYDTERDETVSKEVLVAACELKKVVLDYFT